MDKIKIVIMEKLNRASQYVKDKATGMLIKKQEGNEQLIIALVMIAISVALVLVFKEKINTLLTSFMTSVTTKINTALGA